VADFLGFIGGSFPSGVGEATFDLNARNSSVRSILTRIVTTAADIFIQAVIRPQ
jgi:hypothetical protein